MGLWESTHEEKVLATLITGRAYSSYSVYLLSASGSHGILDLPLPAELEGEG